MRNNNVQAKVLYFLVEDLDYPRNSRVRDYLGSRGAHITVVRRPRRRSKWREYAAIAKLGFENRSGYDLVILAEFSTNAFFVSWLVAKLNGAVHAVDFFVGKYETLVEDRGTFGPKHPMARLLHLFDRAAMASADVAFADTAVRADRFARLHGGRTPVGNLPVGAPAWAVAALASGQKVHLNNDLRLIYYGHYVALHGADVLLEGIIIAAQSIPIRATFVGEGNIKPGMIARVKESGLEGRIVFTGFEEPALLMRRVQRHDVVLGIFGTSPKAGSVIANKVWQGLYAGKTVLTRRSLALDEIAQIAGDRLVQVEAGDSAAIAEGLKALHQARGAEVVLSSRNLAEQLEAYVRQQFDLTFALAALDGVLSKRRTFPRASDASS